MSIDFYADIVRNSEEDKIEVFCECVDLMNLKGWNIKKFAQKCGFEIVSVHDIRNPEILSEENIC